MTGIVRWVGQASKDKMNQVFARQGASATPTSWIHSTRSAALAQAERRRQSRTRLPSQAAARSAHCFWVKVCSLLMMTCGKSAWTSEASAMTAK